MNAFKFPQIVTVEDNLLKSVEALKARNRVFGAVPSIEELVKRKIKHLKTHLLHFQEVTVILLNKWYVKGR